MKTKTTFTSILMNGSVNNFMHKMEIREIEEIILNEDIREDLVIESDLKNI